LGCWQWRRRIQRDRQAQVAHIEGGLKDGLLGCRSAAGVADVRVLGAIGVVEMKQPVDVAQAQARFVERGVWIRPFGKLVYLMPPYVIEDADLAQPTAAVSELAHG
jgi:adenosylmethionine-8-amino-7-oxononanoate aminotransferase